MKKLIIFTDLDGTLLDHYTYSFEKALPALTLLKEKNIPLVICSSKTRKEIEYYRRKLDNHHPFISENGGGIFIPKSYFEFGVRSSEFGVKEEKDYHIIRLGAKYSDLRKALLELHSEGFNVKGFGDMTAEELAGIANMNIDEAEMAKERDFDEPFVFDGSKIDEQRLLKTIIAKGFNYTQGRFFHILGNSDKGKAVSILIDIYKRKFGEIITIAIADSPNDIPMLERVDYPVIVQKPDGSYDPRINIPDLIRAEGIGPVGWNKAIWHENTF
jgi:mannosyl-3-phosphoglycerate phosphatase